MKQTTKSKKDNKPTNEIKKEYVWEQLKTEKLAKSLL